MKKINPKENKKRRILKKNKKEIKKQVERKLINFRGENMLPFKTSDRVVPTRWI